VCRIEQTEVRICVPISGKLKPRSPYLVSISIQDVKSGRLSAARKVASDDGGWRILRRLRRLRVAYPLRFCFVPACGGQAKGGQFFASLSPAADDEVVASSVGGLPPLMTSRTAPVPGSGPVCDNPTTQELAQSFFDVRCSSQENTVPGSTTSPSSLSPSSETKKVMSSGGPCWPLIF